MNARAKDMGKAHLVMDENVGNSDVHVQLGGGVTLANAFVLNIVNSVVHRERTCWVSIEVDHWLI